MKKNFKIYSLLWTILLVLFAVVVFLARPVIPGYEINYDARFWITLSLIFVAFIGNLACAYLTFKAENPKKLFYNLPLLTVSRSALIIMTVAGSVLMLIPDCPAWIAAAVCIFILAVNSFAVIKARWAANTVDQVDEKVKAQTVFIKNMTVEADSLIARAKNEETKSACQKVYEAFRYSDPMSTPALAEMDAQIKTAFDCFKTAVLSDADTADSLADRWLQIR